MPADIPPPKALCWILDRPSVEYVFSWLLTMGFSKLADTDGELTLAHFKTSLSDGSKAPSLPTMRPVPELVDHLGERDCLLTTIAALAASYGR